MRAIPFVEFATKVLQLPLTPAQSVLCRVAFDGVDPCRLEGNERELARSLFGDVEKVPPEARRVLVLTLGRGSGKTSLAAAYALYCMLTGDVSRCGPGDVPVVVVVAPDKKTAALSVRMALEMARGVPDIARLLDGETSDGFGLRRHDGRLVAFEAFAASRGGASARGRSILSFLLDEAQFFRSDDGGAFVINDADIFKALIPRLMRSGRGVFLSTPWATETLMSDLFAKNHGNPLTALAAKGPTALMRSDDVHIADIIEIERARDPENAAREFDCDTSASGGGGYFDPAAINDAVDEVPRPLPRIAHHACAVGVDLGFRSDSSALIVVQYDGHYYHVAHVEELRPARGKPLQPSAVVKAFATIAKGYGATHVIADGHYRESIREHLQAHELYVINAPEGVTGKSETFARTRAVLHEGRLRLPDHSRLLRQLREIVSRPTPGGGLNISSPRRAGGGHGDIVSALVLAVHRLAHSRVTEPERKPEYGSPEWTAMWAKEEQKRMLRETERGFKHWGLWK